jgi:Spy/CpxP family protein refolding chaperone
MTMKACCVEEDSKIHTADEQRCRASERRKKAKHKNFSHQTRKQKKNFNSIHTQRAREREKKIK